MTDKEVLATSDAGPRRSGESELRSARVKRFLPHPAPPNTHRPRERQDIIKRETHQVKFAKPAILEAANNHNLYHAAGSILKDLPRYDDCTLYNISSETADRLLEEEINKLTQFAENEAPPCFDSHGSFNGTSKADFESLSGVADQLICNMSILNLDNARHGVEYGQQVVEEAWEQLLTSRAHLKARFAKDDIHVEGRQPVLLPNADKNALAYQYLLDYLLATTAWWLVRCADSEYWKAQNIAVLAQWAVKLKVVSRNPSDCAETSLTETSALIQKLKLRTESEDVIIKIGGKQKDAETSTNFVNLYCEEKTFIRDSIHHILDYVLAALVKHERSGTEADMFQLCVAMYRRDTDSEKACKIWNGHRHGHLIMSSFLSHFNNCHSMSRLLRNNIAQIRKSSPPTSTPSSDMVQLRGTFHDEGSEEIDLSVNDMDKLVMLMVPLILMTPTVASEVEMLKQNAKAFMRDEQVLKQFRPAQDSFALECMLSTAPWRERPEAKEDSPQYDPDVKPFAESPLRRGIRQDDQIHNALKSNLRVAKVRKAYEAAIPDMRKWHMRTCDITVRCATYVRIIQGLAMMLVFGGLAVPFSVGDRIKGVDPFQIATYTWLLAGFFLVVAKSQYVEEWPWNDFLHGRVECHSVTDLSEVSGIDAQQILLFLLRNEWNNVLNTDGPYNGMFTRKVQPESPEPADMKSPTGTEKTDSAPTTSGAGFSIDVPLNVHTMLASGIVPLKVRDPTGEHLICIDGRKGKWDRALSERRGKWLTCRNFNSEDLEDRTNDDASTEVHRLERYRFRWTKVMGVYVKDSVFG